MTNIVSTEFTRPVNLRYFFVPREVFPRTMVMKMLLFDWADNPASYHFLLGLTENAERIDCNQPRPGPEIVFIQ
jgi:hypothetical protein